MRAERRRGVGKDRAFRTSASTPASCARAIAGFLRLAGEAHGRQNRDMKRAMSDQGTLFGPAMPSRRPRWRQPPKQTTVIISADAIVAMTRGRIAAERIIVEAVRAARPDVRNVAVDLGTIRWTDPKTGRRVTFATPAVLRAALLALAGGAAPEPFHFILERAARAARPATPPPGSAR
jgi:hypothetical protein